MSKHVRPLNILYLAGYATPAFQLMHDDSSASGFGGLRKIESITTALVKQGHNVLILSSFINSKSLFGWRKRHEERLSEGLDNVQVIYPATAQLRPLGGLINCIRAESTVRSLLKEFKPDVMIAYNTYLFEFLASRAVQREINCPMWLEIEDLPLARQREFFNLKPRLDQMCWKGMVNRAKVFTAVNEPILNFLPSDRPKYLLPGVLHEVLVQLSRTRRPPFSRKRKTFGYFGGLSADKGVQVLLDTLHQLPDDWQLIIAGAGSLAPAFAELSRETPERVRFLGKLQPLDLIPVLCDCDCTVIPLERISNQGKGVFPFKTFEYLVAGTHVISAPLPTLRDVDLSFIQRWDGKSQNQLLALLSTAQKDFEQETDVRTSVQEHLSTQFGPDGIASLVNQICNDLLT